MLTASTSGCALRRNQKPAVGPAADRHPAPNPTRLFGLATGQSLNLFMSALGLMLWLGFVARPLFPHAGRGWREAPGEGLWWRRAVFAAILIFCLTMPSDWTQDIPR